MGAHELHEFKTSYGHRAEHDHDSGGMVAFCLICKFDIWQVVRAAPWGLYQNTYHVMQTGIRKCVLWSFLGGSQKAEGRFVCRSWLHFRACSFVSARDAQFVALPVFHYCAQPFQVGRLNFRFQDCFPKQNLYLKPPLDESLQRSSPEPPPTKNQELCLHGHELSKFASFEPTQAWPCDCSQCPTTVVPHFQQGALPLARVASLQPTPWMKRRTWRMK